MLSPLVFEGHCTREVFTCWLEQLGQHLKADTVLILDNASFHKGFEVEALAQRYRIRLVYLPAYSPDLNPIERSWSVLKGRVKQLISIKMSAQNALNLVIQSM